MPSPIALPRKLDIAAFQQASASLTLLENKLPETEIRLLAREVVSRLAERMPDIAHTHVMPTDDEIDQLCDALISGDEEAGAQFILQVRRDGVSMDMVYLGYLAGAAKRLGERWEDDSVSFTDVTIAAGRIFAIMRGLRHVLAPVGTGRQRVVTFASVPGETHTLGITMAADLFRRKGWEIDLRTGLTHEQLIEHFAQNDCAIIGLSASSAQTTAALARLVLATRISNPHALILISGQIAVQEPQIGALTAADAVATDVQSAVGEMQRLMDLASAREHASG